MAGGGGSAAGFGCSLAAAIMACEKTKDYSCNKLQPILAHICGSLKLKVSSNLHLGPCDNSTGWAAERRPQSKSFASKDATGWGVAQCNKDKQ